MNIRIVLDDERVLYPVNSDDPVVILPKHWYDSGILCLVRTDKELLNLWERYIHDKITIIGISFDNDLGEGCMEGKDILSYILNTYLETHPNKLKIEFNLHTANIEAKKSMQALLNSLEKVLLL